MGKLLHLPTSLVARGLAIPGDLIEPGWDWLRPDRRLLELPTPAITTRTRLVPVQTFGGHMTIALARVVGLERWGAGAVAELELVWNEKDYRRDYHDARLVANLMVGANPPDLLVSVIPTWSPMPLGEARAAIERARWAMRRIERRRKLQEAGK